MILLNTSPLPFVWGVRGLERGCIRCALARKRLRLFLSASQFISVALRKDLDLRMSMTSFISKVVKLA